MKKLLRNFFARTGISRRNREIAPDEIFPDVSNLPAFDQSQFEGRIEHPISKQTLVILGTACLLLVVGFTWRLADLQIVSGAHFASVSAENRLDRSTVFANRGLITDISGKELAWNVPDTDAEFARRNYRDNAGLSHILGYVSYPAKDKSGNYYRKEYIGRSGVEASFDSLLDGENGTKLVEQNALDKVSAEVVTEPPDDGETLALTIDAPLQEFLYSRIADAVERAKFDGGAGVLMEIDTGEIRALTSYPSYDPNMLTTGDQDAQIAEAVRNASAPFLNRATAGLYVPGSIVKPFVAAAALAEDVIDPEKEILSTGELVVPNPYNPDDPTVFHDWKRHGWVDMREAIAVSSNVYFYEIGGGFEDQEGLGIERIDRYMNMFGFGEKTGIQLPAEQIGIVPSPKWKEEHFNGDEWRIGDTYHTAIGQFGFQVTPLQMARGAAAIANGGKLFVPTLSKTHSAQYESLDVPSSDLAVVREGMRMTVTAEDGTAKYFNSLKMDVAAKTGTAEVGVDKSEVNSWIIGFFPYEDPKYAFALVLGGGPAGSRPASSITVMHDTLSWIADKRPEYGGIDVSENN